MALALELGSCSVIRIALDAKKNRIKLGLYRLFLGLLLSNMLSCKKLKVRFDCCSSLALLLLPCSGKVSNECHEKVGKSNVILSVVNEIEEPALVVHVGIQIHERNAEHVLSVRKMKCSCQNHSGSVLRRL